MQSLLFFINLVAVVVVADPVVVVDFDGNRSHQLLPPPSFFSICLSFTIHPFSVYFHFLNGPIPASFFIFVFSTRHNSNIKWYKRRWCAWDSYPGRHSRFQLYTFWLGSFEARVIYTLIESNWLLFSVHFEAFEASASTIIEVMMIVMMLCWHRFEERKTIWLQIRERKKERRWKKKSLRGREQSNNSNRLSAQNMWKGKRKVK